MSEADFQIDQALTRIFAALGADRDDAKLHRLVWDDLALIWRKAQAWPDDKATEFGPPY